MRCLVADFSSALLRKYQLGTVNSSIAASSFNIGKSVEDRCSFRSEQSEFEEPYNLGNQVICFSSINDYRFVKVLQTLVKVNSRLIYAQVKEFDKSL